MHRCFFDCCSVLFWFVLLEPVVPQFFESIPATTNRWFVLLRYGFGDVCCVCSFSWSRQPQRQHGNSPSLAFLSIGSVVFYSDSCSCSCSFSFVWTAKTKWQQTLIGTWPLPAPPVYMCFLGRGCCWWWCDQ